MRHCVSYACVELPLLGIDASRALSDMPTGIEGYAYHLLRALLPHLSDWRVRLYFSRPPPADLFPEAEKRVIPFPRLWTHIRLAWEIQRHPPAVLFVPSHVLPWRTPCRSLVTVHDLGFRAFPQAHPWRQRVYLEWSTRHNVLTATHVLADSRATKQAIIEAYRVPEEKITVAYPGYESDLAPVRDPAKLAAVREKYRIPGEYIVFLGRLHPRKNLVRLVEAFALLLRAHPQLILVLAGPSGWLTDPLHERVRALGLEDKVLFPGYITPEDKAALLSGARVFAYPSLYEGFGFPALEAQACGTPLLAGNTSSLPEVVGKGGVLVPPQDVQAIFQGLLRLVEDQSLRNEVVAAGYANLRAFSWEATAATVAQVLRRLYPAGCKSPPTR